MNTQIKYPFTAVEGQDEFKLCLLLNLIDPTIGGVLAVGDKGTGKTTTVRALSQLMELILKNFPFVNLPIGATEDRVLGGWHLEALLKDKITVLQKGLLTQANGGILYIDEVNLLDNFLTDILLDAAASGGYHLEREHATQWFESRFCLVGTKKPEEGNLRPQLLDRFGLSVSIKTPHDLPTRKKIAQRRLDFDLDPSAFYKKFEAEEVGVAYHIKRAKERLPAIKTDDDIFGYASQLCIDHHIEGLRADILLIKAARALASYKDQHSVQTTHIDLVAPFVFLHRKKNNPKSARQRESSQGEEKEGDTESLPGKSIHKPTQRYNNF